MKPVVHKAEHFAEEARGDSRQQHEMTVAEARAAYFVANELGDGGYEDRWVRLQAGPVPIFLPNTKARVAAVRLHDIHHPLTGYDTSWTGEAEIGAFEIASGCGRYVAAWILNLQALAIGLQIAPQRTWRAFVRGRRAANLYHRGLDDETLAMPFAVLRRDLRLEETKIVPTLADHLAFSAFVPVALLALYAAWALTLAPFYWLLRWLL